MVLISLVIPVYNADKTILLLLESVASQSLSAELFEVILVDDGSTDGTVDIVNSYPQILLFSQHNRGPGAARNLGTLHASGSVIVYVDADCILPPDFLLSHLRFHEDHPEIDGLGGGVAAYANLFCCSVILTDHLCSWFNYHNRLPRHVPEYLPSVNMSIKRRVSEAGVRWSERRVTGEDVDFSLLMKKMGMRLLFVPGLYIYHSDRSSIKEFLRHQYNWGFHAPFIRGRIKEADYSFLFPHNIVLAIVLSPVIVCGYTALVTLAWWRHRPVGLLSVMPLIIIGKLWYALGVIRGTRSFVSGSNGIVADRRME